MRVMDELAESTHRRTPPFAHAGAQSPRVGGCVGKLYQVFGWNLSKRYSSTKRIAAERPNQDAFYSGNDRSFTERAISTTSKLPLEVDGEKGGAVSSLSKTPMLLHSTPSSDDANKRVPGVVARLMGLESLPGRTYVSSPKFGASIVLHSDLTEPPRREPFGPPVLLQELLRQDFQQSKKSLKDKFPAFTKLQKRAPSVEPRGSHRGQRPVLRREKNAVSFTPEEGKAVTKLQPVLARLHAGAQPSNSQTPTSPLLSPSMIGGKDTVRLLEAAVKALEPSPRSRYSLSIRDTQSEPRGVISRSERRVRGAGSASSSSRSFRSPSRTSSVKDGHDSGSPGSRSSRACHESGRQAKATRARREINSVSSSRSASPLQPQRPSNTKRAEDSPRALLGTHEASIREFKTDLLNRIDSPSEKKLEPVIKISHQEPLEVAALPENLPVARSPDHTKVDSPLPCHSDQSTDLLQSDIGGTSPSVLKTAASGGLRSIRFRSRSGKQEKDGGAPGNRVFPTDKHPLEKPIGLSSSKEAKPADAAFRHTMLFSRKQGEKKERRDSTFVRSFLKRTSKASKRVNVEKIEPEESLRIRDPASPSPTHKTKEAQARYRSIDDVFPELPMEEKDASPDLGTTIRAVEEKSLGFGAEVDIDCQSIERMFGKGFSTTLGTSPEELVAECCGVPGTFPNSPSATYGESSFPSRNQLNLQGMFEVVSGDHLTSPRRSFSLSEPGERVLDEEEAVAGPLVESCGVVAAEERSEDAVTPPALKKFEERLAHAGWSEDAMTPPALKRFEEKLAQGFSDSDDRHVPCGDEGGQPSPVSVLHSPFLEEPPTTPDAESEKTDEHLDVTEPSKVTDDEAQTQESTAILNVLEVALPETIETDMIEQVILKITAIRNIDVRTIGLEALAIAPPSPDEEQEYIREVLNAANLLKGGEVSHSAINRSLFDRLESGGGILKSDRKLLFDAVAEAMTLEPWRRTSAFYVDLPMLPDLHLSSKPRSLISGELLVTKVYGMISHWRDIAGSDLEELIDYDLNAPEGRWVNFRQEVSDIGLLIERALLRSMITEVVNDLTSITATRALRGGQK